MIKPPNALNWPLELDGAAGDSSGLIDCGREGCEYGLIASGGPASTFTMTELYREVAAHMPDCKGH